jgi:hypothetical protein
MRLKEFPEELKEFPETLRKIQMSRRDFPDVVRSLGSVSGISE